MSMLPLLILRWYVFDLSVRPCVCACMRTCVPAETFSVWLAVRRLVVLPQVVNNVTNFAGRRRAVNGTSLRRHHATVACTHRTANATRQVRAILASASKLRSCLDRGQHAPPGNGTSHHTVNVFVRTPGVYTLLAGRIQVFRCLYR